MATEFSNLVLGITSRGMSKVLGEFDKLIKKTKVVAQEEKKRATATKQFEAAAARQVVTVKKLSNNFNSLSNSINKTTGSLKKETTATKKNKVATDKLAKSKDRLRKSQTGLLNIFTKSVFSIKNLIGTYVALEAIKLADEFVLLKSRVQQSTDSIEDSEYAFSRLQEIAKKTGTTLGASVEIFQRLSFSRKEINATTDDMLAFTETVQNLGRISGTSNQNLEAGLKQLGQAMSSGVVRAEEFNSLLENIPGVANQIAQGLGLTAGQLRLLVVDGKVASKDVFQALLEAQELVQIKAEIFQRTNPISYAFQQARTELQNYIGRLNESFGVTSALADALKWVADNLELLGKYAGIAAAMTAAFASVKLVKAIWSLAAGFTALNAQLALTAGIVIGAGLIAAFFLFREEIEKMDGAVGDLARTLYKEWDSLGEKFSDKIKTVADKTTMEIELWFNQMKLKVLEGTRSLQESKWGSKIVRGGWLGAFGLDNNSQIDETTEKINELTWSLVGMNAEISNRRNETMSKRLEDMKGRLNIFGGGESKGGDSELDALLAKLTEKEKEYFKASQERWKKYRALLEDAGEKSPFQKEIDRIKLATSLIGKTTQEQEVLNSISKAEVDINSEKADQIREEIRLKYEAKTANSIVELKEELRLLKLSKEEREAALRLKKLSDEATPEQIEKMTKLEKAIIDQKKANKDAEKAARDLERQIDKVEDAFRDAFKAGISGAESFSDILDDLNKKLYDIAFNIVWDRIANGLGVGGGRYTPGSTTYSGGGSGIAGTIDSVLRFGAQLVGLFGGGGGAGYDAGNAGGAVGVTPLDGGAPVQFNPKIPSSGGGLALNRGGQFTVGGRSGVDQNTLSLNGVPVARVSKGEEVNVSNPMLGQGSSNGNVYVNMVVNTPNADSFRASQNQIIKETQIAANRVVQRN